MLEAVEGYRAAFRPSAELDRPYVSVSADVVVADDEATARELATGYGLWVRSIRTGEGAIQFPTPDEARAHMPGRDEDRALVADRIETQFVGSPRQVADQLEQLRDATGADELIITTITHDHADRVRSYELLAEGVGDADEHGDSSWATRSPGPDVPGGALVIEQLTGQPAGSRCRLGRSRRRLAGLGDADRGACVAEVQAVDTGGCRQPDLQGHLHRLAQAVPRPVRCGIAGGRTAIPLMLGGDWRHALAPEVFLKPVLAEIGASSPTRGLFLLDSEATEAGPGRTLRRLAGNRPEPATGRSARCRHESLLHSREAPS